MGFSWNPLTNVKNSLGSTASIAGTALGLPEFGISEQLTGNQANYATPPTMYNQPISSFGLEQLYGGSGGSTTQVAGAQNGGDTGGGTQASGGSGGGTSTYNADDLAYLDTQESQLRRLLESAQSALGSGLSNLTDSFNRETGSANQQRGRAMENFGVQRQDMTAGKQNALGAVDTNARTLNDSLRRMLGMASGSGSSAYKFAAPNAVARQASQNRTNVLGDYGKNERDLVLSENRAKTDFEQLLEDLARQRNEKESELRGGVLEREQGIQRDLGNVAGERAKLLGGGYSQVRLAQQPFESAINSRQSELDGLFERFRSPQLTAKPVEVNTPQLRDYMVDRASINANNQGQSSYSPYAQFLKTKDDEQLA